MPFSQIIPTSPTESKRLFYTCVSLLLSRIQGNRYYLSKFHIYVLVYYIGGEGNGTPLQHSCLENPWMEEPGGLQSVGSLRVGHNLATSLSLFTFHSYALEKEMAPHSSVLAWRIPGMGSLVGCRLWGCTESDTTEAT